MAAVRQIGLTEESYLHYSTHLGSPLSTYTPNFVKIFWSGADIRPQNADMLHVWCIATVKLDFWRKRVFRPLRTLRELITYMLTKFRENILIGGRDCPENEIQNWPFGGRILLPVSILTSVIFRGPSCVWSYKISRKSLNARLSYMPFNFFYTYMYVQIYIVNGTTTQCHHAGHLHVYYAKYCILDKTLKTANESPILQAPQKPL